MPRAGTRPAGSPADRSPMEFLVLDVVYLVGVVALFALVALIARAVEKL
ncbi:hypothetical protein ACX80N_07405 [Arthrobacter sp. MDT2-16]